MRKLLAILELFRIDPHRDRVVPATGFTATLTTLTAGAMAFLVVFALALSFAADRLAARWTSALEGTATIRISAPQDQMKVQVERALAILSATQGVETARALSIDEQQTLLEPWFGPDIPLADLPIPRLIEITETSDGFDAQGLRLRLSAEAPGAILDDHMRWRKPLVQAARRLTILGGLSVLVIALTSGAMVMLAARAALAANAQVISVLRLIGAKDSYIVAAFVRRFSVRAFLGAVLGVILGGIAVMFLPSDGATASVLTGLRFQGADWIWLAVVPPALACVAFLATRFAARRVLGELS
jgi:cell division transport system permease protein